MIRIFLAFLMFLGCGAKDGKGDNASVNPEDAAENNETSDNKQTSVYINELTDLPECGDENKNSLAYVKAESAFYYCDGEWLVADIARDEPFGIKSIYSCGPSQDLDADDDILDYIGSYADITEYTNGDYQITCGSRMIDGNYFNSDSDSAISVLVHDSKGVTSGKISCVPMYVTATYTIKTKKIVYQNQADTSQTEEIECEEIYPGN